MTQNNVELANLFQAVTKTLAQNQQTLNQADEFNQDHGTNMVQTFETITRSLQQKQGKPASTALAYAAQQVARKSTSSSGKLYAQGLAQAATQFKGKQVDQKGAMQLLQTLIGGGQSPQPTQTSGGGDMLSSLLGGMSGGEQQQSAGGDLLSTLLGGMAGGEQPQQAQQSSGGDLLSTLLGGMAGGEQPQQAQQSSGGDLLSTLLGGMAGGEQPQQAQQSSGGDLLSTLLGGMAGGNTNSGAQDGLDLGDLLNAGMSYMQAKQSGKSTMQALLQAFMAGSGMGGANHRQQSTALVVNSFLQALGAAGK